MTNKIKASAIFLIAVIIIIAAMNFLGKKENQNSDENAIQSATEITIAISSNGSDIDRQDETFVSDKPENSSIFNSDLNSVTKGESDSNYHLPNIFDTVIADDEKNNDFVSKSVQSEYIEKSKTDSETTTVIKDKSTTDDNNDTIMDQRWKSEDAFSHDSYHGEVAELPVVPVN